MVRHPPLRSWLGLLIGLLLVAGSAACSRPAAADGSVEPLGSSDGCVHLYVFRAAWCTQCRYVKPAALQVADEYAGRVRVSLVQVEGAKGSKLADRYAVRCLPAALVVDSDGEPLGGLRCGFATYLALQAVAEEGLEKADCAE